MNPILLYEDGIHFLGVCIPLFFVFYIFVFSVIYLNHYIYGYVQDEREDEYNHDNVADKRNKSVIRSLKNYIFTLLQENERLRLTNNKWKTLQSTNSNNYQTLQSEYENVFEENKNLKAQIQFDHDEKNEQNGKKKKKRLLTNDYTTKYGNIATYDPPESMRVEGNIEISKKFTLLLLPTMIRENISDIFHFINNNTALQFKFEYNNGKIRIFNHDFHDRINNNPLYCVAERDEKNKRGYPWKMIEKVFTADELENIYHISFDKLPKSIRSLDKLKNMINIQHIIEIENQTKYINYNTKLIKDTK
eukprot:273145_1